MAVSQCRVMMFPWLAFGHMLPFLELSKKLAAKGIIVSFVSTPKNLQRLPSIPSNLADRIMLLEIPIPGVPGLPENCEATLDLQPDKIQYLKKAYDELTKPFEELLKKNLPDLVLLDFAPYLISESAAKFGVPTAFFSVYTASTLAYLGPPADLRCGKRRSAPQFPDVSGVTGGQRMAKVVEESSFIIIRTCTELEGEYLNLVEEHYQRPVQPIGVLPPIPDKNMSDTDTPIESSLSGTFKWLNEQTPKSVLFVGFGSEYKMPIEQIHELAFALELSRLPFLWILRKPEGVEMSNLLPPGFINRTSSQGIVTLGWVPQMEILAHPAIGGCLFHSGWGTVIEALCFGHPLILLPMVADQGLNAKVLMEKDLGYNVPRNEDGSFSRDMVAKSVRKVMLEPEGEPLKLKASHMRNIFNNQDLQDNYISKFIQHLEKCKGSKAISSKCQM